MSLSKIFFLLIMWSFIEGNFFIEFCAALGLFLLEQKDQEKTTIKVNVKKVNYLTLKTHATFAILRWEKTRRKKGASAKKNLCITFFPCWRNHITADSFGLLMDNLGNRVYYMGLNSLLIWYALFIYKGIIYILNM